MKGKKKRKKALEKKKIAVGVILIVACGIFQHAITEKRHKTINNECREYDKLTEKGDLT